MAGYSSQILVTVGTTGFDSLVRAADALELPHARVRIQYGPSRFVPRLKLGAPWFKDWDLIAASADIVVSHAGAGSVFGFLDLGKPLIVVPNLERTDRHQLDICRYLANRRLAFVCWSLPALGFVVDCLMSPGTILSGDPLPDSAERFFAADEIISFITN